MVEKKENEITSKKTPKKAVKKAVKKVAKKATKQAKVKDVSIVVHTLVPLHEKLSEAETKELFEYHNITIKELPKILKKDAAIRHLDVKENDIIKITRMSPTAGKTSFYRGVINE